VSLLSALGFIVLVVSVFILLNSTQTTPEARVGTCQKCRHVAVYNTGRETKHYQCEWDASGAPWPEAYMGIDFPEVAPDDGKACPQYQERK